ncbi:carbohydrate-binding domain-containing protein [Streptomyces flaveolus]|uniref:carbohydrate-binding domain-containing protein n=1 Tax=Streptomyces flaveolus TaxID=67297 RepID=UPI0034497C1B
MKVEAESADAYQDRTPGNTYTSYRDGDIDVQKEPRDTGGGWNVGGIDDGEWLQWQEVGMQGTKDLKVRVATPNSTAQLRFVIDGVAGPTVTVPTTGDWHAYQTVDAGTFSFKPGTAHTVRLEALHGGFNLNWCSAETGTPATPATPAPTAPTGPITGYGGKCVDDADSSTADRNPIQLWTCNGNAGTGNGTVVQLYTCNGTAAQKWSYDPAGRTLRNPQSGRCLDATGPSSADGTRLQIWDCAYTDNQQWNLPG